MIMVYGFIVVCTIPDGSRVAEAGLKAAITHHSCLAAGQAAVAKEAAGVLWRVATDCDKAKLEIAKAGAVGPAVAMLQAGDRNAASIASATEVMTEVALQSTNCVCCTRCQTV